MFATGSIPFLSESWSEVSSLLKKTASFKTFSYCKNIYIFSSPFLFICFLLAQLTPIHSLPASLMLPGSSLEARSIGWISWTVPEFLKCPSPSTLFRLVISFHLAPLDNWQSSDTLRSLSSTLFQDTISSIHALAQSKVPQALDSINIPKIWKLIWVCRPFSTPLLS